MKMKKVNALLSLTLAFTLFFGQVGMVYAAEKTDVTMAEESNGIVAEESNGEIPDMPDTDEKEDTSTDVEEVPEEGSDISDKEGDEGTETNKEVSILPEEGQEEISDTSEEGQEEISDTSEEGQEEIPEILEEDDMGLAGSEENLQDSGLSDEKKQILNRLGFKTKNINQAMVQEKSALAQVVLDLATMKSGEDYVENEVIYLSDSEEEALEIAECYGGTVTTYEYGVAVTEIERTVEEAVKVAADMEIAIPAVYPNIKYKLDDGRELVAEEKSKSTDNSQYIDEVDAEHEKDSGLEDVSAETGIIHVTGETYATNPSDPGYKDQWHHNSVNTTEAWRATKGAGITVAVLDTGIDFTHPDLKENIVDHVSMIGGDGRDGNGHGTHCAGIIAADENSIGGIGIAPEAQIYSVKVMDDEGYGTMADTIRGIENAREKGVDVISMSLGWIQYSPLFQTGINKAVNEGIVVVASAGNETTAKKSYPAAYSNVISVAATDADDDLTSFSNYGTWVDIAAPGQNICSTLPQGMVFPEETGVKLVEDGFGYMSGTSMACPLIAGTVALMLANNNSLGNITSKSGVSKIEKTLVNSTYEKASTWNGYQTGMYPIVDVEAAVYAVDKTVPEVPEIQFLNEQPDNKNVVLAGEGKYFAFKTSTPHAKIYYTINGKKPTIQTGNLYENGDSFEMTDSGKMKIQAVTVVGKKVSKVFSKTYTFDVKATNVSSINENMTVVIGKSVQLGVDIYPSYASTKKMDWTSSDATKMKVNNNGKVTCTKKTNENDEVTITATTKDGSNLSCKFVLKATKDIQDELTINAPSVNLSYWRYREPVSSELEAKGYERYFDLEPKRNGIAVPCLYKSSNKKVAMVNENGRIIPLAKGKAKITVTANDGSGQKKVCNVTVVTPVFDIYSYSSTGYSGNGTIPIGTGCSITMKTELNYNSKIARYIPDNKKLVWVSSDPSKITVKNGKVTCKPDAKIGEYVNITATADDGWGTSCTIRFFIVDKIEKIYYVDKGQQFTNVGAKMKVGEFIRDPLLCNNPQYQLVNIKTMHNEGIYVHEESGLPISITMSNSNRDVVYWHYSPYVDDGEYIIDATKAGSSTFTYTARDGSNAKFTIKFQVSGIVDGI